MRELLFRCVWKIDLPAFSSTLVIGWMLASSYLTAKDHQPLAPNDTRFRLLQLSETQPTSLPPDTAINELTCYEYRLGADDTAPLKIAIHHDHQRLWLDSQRNGTWSLAQSSMRDGVIQWTSQVLAQPASNRSTLWPSPESISITLQRDATTGAWMIATDVQLDGQLELNGCSIAYQLRDENSDGKLEGVEDSLRIDVNGDGRLDPLREVYPLTKLFRLQGGRYALGLDREAKRFHLQSIDATGLVQLNFDGWAGLEQPPSRMIVVLQSDTGVQVVCNNTEPQVAPVGTYHIYSATLYWDGTEKWCMTFARATEVTRVTYQVDANQTVPVSVLGKTELSAQIQSLKYADNMWQMTIHPAMFTESGLYLTRASSGREYASADGRLIANVGAEREQQVLTTGSTQFACGTFCPINLSWKGESASHITLRFDTGPMAGLLTSQIQTSQIQFDKK